MYKVGACICIAKVWRGTLSCSVEASAGDSVRLHSTKTVTATDAATRALVTGGGTAAAVDTQQQQNQALANHPTYNCNNNIIITISVHSKIYCTKINAKLNGRVL